MICDAHCHFFSRGFFETLAKDLPDAPADPASALPAKLGWEAPGDDQTLSDRWVAELDRNGVDRAMLIASAPGDEASVGAAVKKHPKRFIGAFMFNPAVPDAEARLDRAFGEFGLRTVCLFPAMHRVPVDDPRVEAVFAMAEKRNRVVFVHCGLLSVGVRKKLGLRSAFDLRLGDPLGVGMMAARYPGATVIIPHFGAGFLREALVAADTAPNIVLDSSSSNSWIKFEDRLTLADIFRRTLDTIGSSRILFGTDSSFFPRGWQKPIYDAQKLIFEDMNLDQDTQERIFSDNFGRIFGR